ncbi:hypothetical protein L211DRAFT_838434, partial [Terfezia boudieri ATCC MYA-4762]
VGTSGVMSQFDGLDNPAFLYIRTYPVSSFWLFEQYSKFEVHSKFNRHLYVHPVRPEFGDRDIARSNSPNFPMFRQHC